MNDENIQIEENNEKANKYLIFEADEIYALELSKVIEILEFKSVTKVPETPSYIAGMMNLRGNVIPVIDLRERLKLPPANESTRKCIITVNFDSMNLGIIVDNVTDLILIPKEKTTPPPQVGTDYKHIFIKSIGITETGMTLILDSEKLINYSDLNL